MENIDANLEDDIKLEEAVDLTSLPTFGGKEPSDTMGVWSWDETRLLVGEGKFKIINREDW